MSATKWCNSCGQKIRKLNPHRMDKTKVQILERVAKLHSCGHQWVKMQQDGSLIRAKEHAFTIQTDAVHALRLCWFGLLERQPERTGLFKVTKEGFRFLCDKHSVPTTLYCKDGEVIEQ